MKTMFYKIQKQISLKSIFLFLLLCALKSNAQEIINSPNNKLKVQVSVLNGKPTYTVFYNEKVVLEQSPLGLKTNVGDFSNGLELSTKIIPTKIDESYKLPNIKQSKVRYIANETSFSFTKENKPAIDIIFRVSNNDVAF